MVKFHKGKTLRSGPHNDRSIHFMGAKYRDYFIRIGGMRLSDYCLCIFDYSLDSFLQFVLQGVFGRHDKENGI